MLDLKAKLAAAGLVSQEDVAKAEAARNRPQRGNQRGGQRGSKPAAAPPRPAALAVAALRAKNKGEIYDAVRRFVDRVRLDVVGTPPTEAAEPFHFAGHTGRVGRLVLEPEVSARLLDGSAALVSYMSNHGLAHAVVPADAGREIGQVMPLWLRVLAGDPQAGQLEPPPAPADGTGPAA